MRGLQRNRWVAQIKEMLDERYPDAIKVRLVMDNLTPTA
jgi:hypothetical protein